METDPIRMCELLVGLPEVRVLGVERPDDGSPLVVHVACPEDWQRDCGRCGTLHNWTSEILVWHTTRASNGPTEGQNNLSKATKRVGFGFRTFGNYRIRVLLDAGGVNWNLLPTLTPH